MRLVEEDAVLTAAGNVASSLIAGCAAVTAGVVLSMLL
jgi:hypothetical protein